MGRDMTLHSMIDPETTHKPMNTDHLNSSLLLIFS